MMETKMGMRDTDTYPVPVSLNILIVSYYLTCRSNSRDKYRIRDRTSVLLGKCNT